MPRKNSVTIMIAAVLIALAVAIFFVPAVTSLTVSKDGRIVYAEKIRSGDMFSITYMHSANRSPVKDTVEYNGSELIVRCSLFQTFGAGIPIAEDGGTLVKTEAGLLLSGINRVHEKIDLMTGTYADHHLITPTERDIKLKTIAGEQKHIVIEVKKIGLIYLLPV